MNQKLYDELFKSGLDPLYRVVLGRCEGTLWSPMILKTVEPDLICPFKMYSIDGEDWDIEYIAPLLGNESAIDTEDDVFDLWDFKTVIDILKK